MELGQSGILTIFICRVSLQMLFIYSTGALASFTESSIQEWRGKIFTTSSRLFARTSINEVENMAQQGWRSVQY